MTMSKLLMITGDRALAQGKMGAFWNTISEFHKHWNRIDIITPCIPEHRYDMIVFGNVHVHPSPLPLMFQSLWIWWKGKGLVREQHHDLMTVHSYPLFYNDIGGWILSRATKLPYVLEVMHIEGWPKASGFRDLLNRWLRRMSLPWDARRARAVRVINENETSDYLVKAGVPREKLLHIPAFYIDSEVFRERDVSKKFDVIFVGRLVANKGLKLFMQVVRRTGLKALIVGDGPLRQWAQDYAKKYRVSTVFHGFAKDQREVAECMTSAHILMMLSDNEGGPRVVLESLACGTPVVATPVGIVPDVLPPEAIEEWDVSALADKVQNILGDAELYARLKFSGITSVQRFEKKAAIKHYADELKKLIE